ncbi:MAG: hypothetical protein H0X30_22165 [Anaerolineae bacterium]|nr:hypothetical protein [Anaerolineae bacterium]
MKHFILRMGWFVAVLCLAPALLLAQAADCPSLVKDALNATKHVCSDIGRNQACYGNAHLEATSRDGGGSFSFTKPGDLADLVNVEKLKLSPLDAQNQVWGVGLMKVQANIPDTLPGQNVTFVLFGDVQIQNAITDTTAPTQIDVTTTRTLHLWEQPSSGENVAVAVRAKTTLVANGRLQDNTWLHGQLADGSEGWVFADFVKANGDVCSLAVIDPTASPIYHPMQAFYFQSGLEDRPCKQAPDSGILIQTPKGAGKIRLLADDVEIQLGSTAYLQAQANGSLTIAIIEGSGRVTARGITVVVPAGTQVKIPLDGNLKAIGQPSKLETYDVPRLRLLPVVLLQRRISVATALTVKQIDKLPPPGVPNSGTIVASNANPLGAGCSVKGDTATTVTFTNNSQRSVSSYWINYQCKEVFYNKVPPGASYKQPTYATHPWIVRDTETNALLAGPFVSKDGSPFSVTISQ